MRKPDGHKTLPNPNSLDRYSGSAFIFQWRAKENSEGWGWVGRREKLESTPTVTRRLLLTETERKCKEKGEGQHDRGQRYVPTQFSFFFAYSFSPHSFSRFVCFQALLALFVFLSNLHFSFTLLWPCLSHSDLLHRHTRCRCKKNNACEGRETERKHHCTQLPTDCWSVFIIHWTFTSPCNGKSVYLWEMFGTQ